MVKANPEVIVILPLLTHLGVLTGEQIYHNAQEDSHFYKWEMNCANII